MPLGCSEALKHEQGLDVIPCLFWYLKKKGVSIISCLAENQRDFQVTPQKYRGKLKSIQIKNGERKQVQMKWSAKPNKSVLPGTPNNHFLWLESNWMIPNRYIKHAWKSPFPCIKTWLFGVPGSSWMKNTGPTSQSITRLGSLARMPNSLMAFPTRLKNMRKSNWKSSH